MYTVVTFYLTIRVHRATRGRIADRVKSVRYNPAFSTLESASKENSRGNRRITKSVLSAFHESCTFSLVADFKERRITRQEVLAADRFLDS